MARGRMLDQAFVRSRKLQSSSRDVRLMYASILPFLDREGRVIAEPEYLKGNVFRWSDFTLEEIAAGVKALAAVGLVRLYADEDNAAILEYVGFLALNSPNKKEAQTTFPGPDDPTAQPCRDPLLVDSKPEHVQRTGNAPATPVTSRGKSSITINGTERLTINDQRNTNTSISQVDDPPPKSLAAAPPRESHDPGIFLEAWNAHRGRLPAVQALNSKRRGAIRALVKEHGPTGALDLFRDATLAVAHDDFWLSRQYGFDNLLSGGKVLARAEQWRAGAHKLGEGNLRLAANVERWARALPSPDETPETAVN